MVLPVLTLAILFGGTGLRILRLWLWSVWECWLLAFKLTQPIKSTSPVATE